MERFAGLGGTSTIFGTDPLLILVVVSPTLVGGLEHFIFPYIGNFINPTDFHIFQRGRYTTNQIHSWIISSGNLHQIEGVASRNWGMCRLIQRTIPQWSYPMYD